MARGVAPGAPRAKKSLVSSPTQTSLPFNGTPKNLNLRMYRLVVALKYSYRGVVCSRVSLSRPEGTPRKVAAEEALQAWR